MIPTRIGLLAGRGAGAGLMQAAICWAQSRGKQHCGWRPGWAPPRLNVTYKAVPTSKALRTGYTGDNMIPFNAPPVVNRTRNTCGLQ